MIYSKRWYIYVARYFKRQNIHWNELFFSCQHTPSYLYAFVRDQNQITECNKLKCRLRNRKINYRFISVPYSLNEYGKILVLLKKLIAVIEKKLLSFLAIVYWVSFLHNKINIVLVINARKHITFYSKLVLIKLFKRKTAIDG